MKNRVPYDPNDPNRRKLERDLEAENGGAGVYNVDLKSNLSSIIFLLNYLFINWLINN